MPRLKYLGFPFVYLIQLLCRATKKVSRSQDLGHKLSSYSRQALRQHTCGVWL